MVDSGQTADTEATDSTAPGAGAVLRSARESRELSVEEVSTDLRIESHLLQALESEDYAKLGAPVFAKGYIRQYANRLGLDPAPLVASYLDATGHADIQIEPSRVIRLRDGQHYTISILAVLSFALVIVFLLVWWFREPATVGTDLTTGAPQSEPRELPFEDAEPTALPDGPGPEPAARATATDPVPAQGPAAPDSSQPTATAAPPEAGGGGATAPAVAAGAGPARPAASGPDSAAASAAGVAAAARAGSESPGATSSPAGGRELDIVFIDDCWVEVTDADGERLLYGLVAAGTRREFVGRAPLDVILGNADAAQIRIDGRDFTVPAASRRGNLARFVIPASTN